MAENELVEWHYIVLHGHYGYWVIANNKSDFAKKYMTALSKVFLPKGEKAEYKNTRNAIKITLQNETT